MMADYSISDIVKTASAFDEQGQMKNLAIHPSARDRRMRQDAEQLRILGERLDQLADDYRKFGDLETVRAYRYAAYSVFNAENNLRRRLPEGEGE